MISQSDKLLSSTKITSSAEGQQNRIDRIESSIGILLPPLQFQGLTPQKNKNIGFKDGVWIPAPFYKKKYPLVRFPKTNRSLNSRGSKG